MNKVWIICTQRRYDEEECEEMKVMRVFPGNLLEEAKSYAKSLILLLEDQSFLPHKILHTEDIVQIIGVELEKKLPPPDINENTDLVMEYLIDNFTGRPKVRYWGSMRSSGERMEDAVQSFIDILKEQKHIDSL